MYGTDTWDSRPYDIVLHIGRLTVDDAVDILFDTVKKPNFQATPQSLKLVDDLALAAKVKAALAEISPKIQVAADHGSIHIGNMDKDPESPEEAQIRRIVLKIEGVEEVTFSAGASRQQHGHVNPFHNIG